MIIYVQGIYKDYNKKKIIKAVQPVYRNILSQNLDNYWLFTGKEHDINVLIEVLSIEKVLHNCQNKRED